MEQLKATLSRRIGPFTVGVWLIVVVVGVGVGLLVRRRLGTSTADVSGSAEPLDGPVEGGPGTFPSGPSGIAGQGGAPVTITRTELVETVDREVVSNLFDRLESIEGRVVELPRLVRVGSDQPVSSTPTGTTERDAVRAEFIRLFGVPPSEAETTDRWKRRIAAGLANVAAGLTPTGQPKTTTTSAATVTGTKYVVVSGDSLSRIGARFGIPWETIYNANRATIGPNPNLIHPGQVLIIPK